ncbi:tape measure protein [Vagococcus fluvialis]|uniref:tape measure protein n=1 Tax=Vagococcus fluvialis TaxID=2738 RepID=UPI003D0D0F6C
MVQSKSVTAVLRAKDSGFTSTFRKTNSLLGTLSGKQQQATSTSKGFLGGIKSVAVGMGVYKAAATVARTVTNNLSAAMSRQDTLYLYNRNLKQMGYSAKVVTKNQNELSDAVQDTAYALDSVANSTQSFANSSVSLKKSTEYSTRFMDLISRYGDGTNETYKQVMLQMNQMSSKGKANLGDIKSAVEAQIPVWSILSKQTGKSMGEIQDEISAGKWSSEKFFDTLMKGSNDAAGAAKDGANTWSGAIGIMKSRFALGVGDILTSVKKVATVFTGDEFGLYKGITQLGSFVRSGFTTAGEYIEKFALASIPYINIFKGAIQDMKGPVTEAFQAVISNVGFMNSSFSKTDALRGFSNVVGFVSDKVIQLSGFIEQNSVVIGKAIDLAPQLLTAFMALKGISAVGQTFALFGHNLTTNVINKLETLNQANEIASGAIKGLGSTISGGLQSSFGMAEPIISKFTTNFKYSMSTLSEFDDKGKFLNFTRSIGESLSSLFPSFDLFRANLKTSRSQLDSLGGSSVGNFFRSFTASLELSNGKLLSFSNFVKHPISGLKSFGAGLIESTGKSNVFAAGISAAGTKVGSGLKAMSTMGIGAIRSLSAAMLSNPITAALLAITAAVAFTALSWRNNFMNIQGVIKSFTAGVGNSLSSMKGMFTGLEPVIQPVTNAFKGLGKILTGVVLVGVAAVVDVFRTLVLGITTVLKSVQALSFGMTGLWKKIKGDSKGADESFKKMKTSIDAIGDGFDNWKNNSAIVSTGKALGEFGKTADDTSKRVTASFDLSAQRVTDFSNQFSTKISEVNSKFGELFSGEGSSDRLKEYTANGIKILTDFGEKQVAVSEKYNDLMQQAEQAKGDEQQAILAKANDLLLSENRTSNASMLALYKEYSNQLKTNKNIEGQELTAEQRQALREQTNAIREGLAEQNELYVQASLNKLEMEGKLNDSEQKAAESNLKALYSSKKEQITSNEDQIQELVAQRNEAKSESEKQSIQAQIDTLAAGNQQLLEQQMSYGEQQLALIMNGNELTAEAVTQGLASRKDITDEQLGQIFQSFVNSNTSIDEQMALLGGIMENRGFEGSQLLGEALRSGNLSALGGELTAEMEAGISGLPNTMFWGGESGKTMFINALKNGDYASAGQFITESVDGALQQGTAKAGNEGAKTGKDYSSNVSNQQGAAKKSGTDVSTSTTEGMKSQHGKQQEAGKTSGTRFTTGVSSQSSAARTAGESLANAAYNGANSRTSEFHSVGYNMGMGVANGLNAALPSVKAAAEAIATEAEKAVKAKAQIKSPARRFIPLGDFIGQGVGVGMLKSVGFIKSKIADVVSSIQSEFKGDLATSYDMNLMASSEMKVTHSQDNSFTNSLINEVKLLREYVQELRMQIYLDTGVLVGEVDSGLGNEKDKNGRYKL